MLLTKLILNEKSQAQQFLFFDSIYIELKTRRNYSMVMDVRVTVTFGVNGDWEEYDENFYLAKRYSKNILFFNLGDDYPGMFFVYKFIELSS